MKESEVSLEHLSVECRLEEIEQQRNLRTVTWPHGLLLYVVGGPMGPLAFFLAHTDYGLLTS